MLMQTSIISCICGSDLHLVTDPECGEIICSKCGLVSSERILENRAEWREFQSETNDRKRTGSPVTLTHHDMGLSTIIGKENKDSSGRRLDASVSRTIQRLRTWDFRTTAHSSRHRGLIRPFQELSGLKEKLGLSDAITEKTAYVFRKAHEKSLLRGRSSSSMLAAAIYASCRELGASRTLRDIATGTDVKRKDISRSYRILVTELDIKVPLMDPMKCIVKIGNKAAISEKTKRTAMKTMTELVEAEMSAGKLPMGLAATVLYISCLKNGENKTQKEIADAAGVTEVTIRNRFKDLKHRFELN
jgi:transcription initiation factor TFIIB